MTKSKWFNSSASPEDLSMTIKGMLLLYVPMAVALAQFLHLPLSTSTATDVVGEASFIIAAAMTLYGLGRKVYFAIKKVV